jgi:hypothetical protein
MSNGNFNFNEFVNESKGVLLNPDYFSTMKTTGGMTEPLIKAVIYGAIAGVISLIWNTLSIGNASTSWLGGSSIGIMILIWGVIGAIIGLFLGGVILLVISSICKGNTDFEANVRVTSAIMVMMPINAFLGFASGFNLYLGLIVSIAVTLFTLWLVYKGLVQAMKARIETTRTVMYILAAVFVVVMLLGVGAARKANQIMNSFNKEMLKDIPEN